MYEHIGAGQREDLPVEFYPEQLGLLNLLRLISPIAPSLLHHIAHSLHQECPRSTGGIQHDVILTCLGEAIHQRGDVVGGEYLPLLRLPLVAVELVEEYRHDILSLPEVRVDVVRDFLNATDKFVDGLLIIGDIHPDSRVNIQQDVQLAVLLDRIGIGLR